MTSLNIGIYCRDLRDASPRHPEIDVYGLAFIICENSHTECGFDNVCVCVHLQQSEI